MTMTTNHVSVANIPATSLAGKYLTFILGQEYYGMPVLRVREIMRLVQPTHVPQLPEHIKGVINLRGKVIPVVDLRLKFGMPVVQADERTCIIVVQTTQLAAGAKVMGMIVDGVEEVSHIAASEIEAAPDFGAGLDIDYILGMAKVRNTVKTLLDIDKVLLAETVKASSLESRHSGL